MTLTSQLWKALWRPKFKISNQFLLLIAVATVLSALYVFVKGELTRNVFFGIFSGWAIFLIFLTYFFLARQNERVNIEVTYRLIPVPEYKLYLVNLGTSLVAWLYQMLVVFVTLVVMTSIALRTLDWRKIFGVNTIQVSMSPGADDLAAILGFVLVMLGAVLWAWSAISLEHLLKEWITDYLPATRQKVVKGIVYIVLIWAGIKLLATISQQFGHFFHFAADQNVLPFYASAGYLFLLLIVTVIINIYLLTRWVEAK
jgi:hypothetical protein